MLLVTPSWPGALSWGQSRLRPSKLSQWKHTAAVLLFQLFYLPFLVSHLSNQGVDVLGHFGLLWLCNASLQMLSIPEVFLHLHFPAGQLLSISEGQ
ncbi:hypothetical protein T4D_1821 [Trichinella pseudospiralis]|uniref:Uncharacterized protein n=1 Tax=Trichinella pseudospiralis TaxID=6337 RepID=A0A0V1F346_TRIPS|nr:hypothetical protein T4D_1821 [Trichinella pseudospiralis]